LRDVLFLESLWVECVQRVIREPPPEGAGGLPSNEGPILVRVA